MQPDDKAKAARDQEKRRPVFRSIARKTEYLDQILVAKVCNPGSCPRQTFGVISL
jgi:hypothetical protein